MIKENTEIGAQIKANAVPLSIEKKQVKLKINTSRNTNINWILKNGYKMSVNYNHCILNLRNPNLTFQHDAICSAIKRYSLKGKLMT